jgi:hypothetical protein
MKSGVSMTLHDSRILTGHNSPTGTAEEAELLTIAADVGSPRGDGGEPRRQSGVGRSRCDARVATTRQTRLRRDICGRKVPGKA